MKKPGNHSNKLVAKIYRRILIIQDRPSDNYLYRKTEKSIKLKTACGFTGSHRQ